MTLYDELGVPTDASEAEITAAYRRCAKQYHPDAGGDAAAFERISKAALVLRDPGRRAHYDATGETDAEPRNEQSEAVSMVVQAFTEVLGAAEGADIKHRDLIASTDARLAERLNGLKVERSQALELQRQTAEALTRLKHSGDGADFIRKVLEDRQRAIAGALAELDRREGVIATARELTKAYVWTVDPRPEQQPFSWNDPAVLQQIVNQAYPRSMFDVGKI